MLLINRRLRDSGSNNGMRIGLANSNTARSIRTARSIHTATAARLRHLGKKELETK